MSNQYCVPFLLLLSASTPLYGEGVGCDVVEGAAKNAGFNVASLVDSPLPEIRDRAKAQSVFSDLERLAKSDSDDYQTGVFSGSSIGYSGRVFENMETMKLSTTQGYALEIRSGKTNDQSTLQIRSLTNPSGGFRGVKATMLDSKRKVIAIFHIMDPEAGQNIEAVSRALENQNFETKYAAERAGRPGRVTIELEGERGGSSPNYRIRSAADVVAEIGRQIQNPSQPGNTSILRRKNPALPLNAVDTFLTGRHELKQPGFADFIRVGSYETAACDIWFERSGADFYPAYAVGVKMAPVRAMDGTQTMRNLYRDLDAQFQAAAQSFFAQNPDKTQFAIHIKEVSDNEMRQALEKLGYTVKPKAARTAPDYAKIFNR